MARELGAEWLEPTQELVAECDILAPCALGGAIDAANLPLLRCEIVCGCANNQLADDASRTSWTSAASSTRPTSSSTPAA